MMRGTPFHAAHFADWSRLMGCRSLLLVTTMGAADHSGSARTSAQERVFRWAMSLSWMRGIPRAGVLICSSMAMCRASSAALICCIGQFVKLYGSKKEKSGFAYLGELDFAEGAEEVSSTLSGLGVASEMGGGLVDVLHPNELVNEGREEGVGGGTGGSWKKSTIRTIASGSAVGAETSPGAGSMESTPMISASLPAMMSSISGVTKETSSMMTMARDSF
ncbi:hypothetical protein OUZ56_016522 [Daphnia magna]|uniref:Uncharacterized protein n=1 Tax=Daphnia magna TaxID=35525 RepID=A0ABR0AQX2_9CRUS|nr:hypothetical protein OUZ56_016522 [Daphnia magna]